MSDKSQALLAYVAVESHRPHRRDHLAGMLWPNQPENKALHSLRQALSSLRKTLQDRHRENQFIIVTRDSIQFNNNCDHELDIRKFNALINKAFQFYNRDDDESSRIHFRALKQAAVLYQGHFLDQFYLKESVYFEEWSMLQREILTRKVLEILNCLVEYYERQGNYQQALQFATRMVELAPWEEHAHRIVMLQLALNGQFSAAGNQYHSLARYLKQEIGLEPTAETVKLYEEIRSTSAKGEGLEPRFLPTVNQLPSFSNPFIGRQIELDELADLLTNPHSRLLTITGPGGVGKTRLAIEAAREQIGLFHHGVYYVSLSDIQNDINIIPRIAEVVSFNFSDQGSPKSQLQKYLQTKKLLLILDNFEHLIEYANLIADLLNSSPGLVIIITTRERLKLKEEWVLSLDGLSYPHMGVNPDNQKAFDAIRLFEVCVQQVNRDFRITPLEKDSIVQICRVVEGNPQAIEIAASLTYTKSCFEIAEQLTHNYEVLSTNFQNVQPRQRSLQATMQYSWDLLAIEEKDALSQLSIFLEYFDPDAALNILGIDSTMLTTLMSKSLIRKTSDERYIFHTLLRQFARRKLGEDISKHRTVEERYCNYYLNLLLMQADRLDGYEQSQALIEINQNIDNFRKTWGLLISHQRFSDLEQIVDTIYRFHTIRSHFNQCIELFNEAFAGLAGTNNHEMLTRKINARQGVLYQRLGKYGLAKKYLDTSLSTFRSYNETKEIIFCLVQLGNTYLKLGEYEEVKSKAAEALKLATSIEDQWGITSSYYLSGFVDYRLGEIEKGKRDLEKALHVSRASRRPRLLLNPLNALGDIACHQGEYSKAIQIYEECIQLSVEIGDEYQVGIHYNNLGTVFHILEQYQNAEAYYLESLHICMKIGDLVGQAVALSNLGEIKLIQKEYPESRRLFLKGLGIARDLDDHWSIMACLKNLGAISLTENDLVKAKRYYAAAFDTGIKHRTKPQVLNILLDLAEYLSNNGNLDLAAEMLTLIVNHPSSEKIAREKAKRILERNFDNANSIDPRPMDLLIEHGLSEMSKKIHP